MRSLANLRRQIEALRQADVAALELPKTPEQKRQSLIEFLAGPKGCVKAFGQDDERSQPDYLNRLSYHELLLLYQQVMKALATQLAASGKADWFKRLPLQARIAFLYDAARRDFAVADREWREMWATTCDR